MSKAPPRPDELKSQGAGFLRLPGKGQVFLVAIQDRKWGGGPAVCVLSMRSLQSASHTWELMAGGGGTGEGGCLPLLPWLGGGNAVVQGHFKCWGESSPLASRWIG